MIQIIHGDCREEIQRLQAESVNCIITSPPYWRLRDYDTKGQIGLEIDVGKYIKELVNVFRLSKRVLKKNGTVWLNMGDTYASTGDGSDSGSKVSKFGQRPNRKTLPPGFKNKDLMGLPWRVVLALHADGWYLRSDIIWHKTNPRPSPVDDRPTTAHEYVFLLAHPDSKGQYYYDSNAIREKAIDGTRNKRTVWSIYRSRHSKIHPAIFPEKLITPCVLAGCPANGIILDPFAGSGTTGIVAEKYQRNAILIETSIDYIKIIKSKTAQMSMIYS